MADRDQTLLRLRRINLFETAVFLLVLLPWMGFATLGARPENLDFPTIAVVIMFHDFALMALAIYLVWRNGEGIAAVGWIRAGAAREVAIGVGLFIPMTLVIALLEGWLQATGLAEPAKTPSYLLPQSGTEYALAFLLLIVVAVSEETIFRGYLLRRFSQLTGSRWIGVAVTSAIFALGHAYQGSLGVVAVGVIGVILALVYLKRGSLVAPITMHFIQDFIGLIIVPRFFS